MQVSSLNEVKIYSLSCGKSLPEVSLSSGCPRLEVYGNLLAGSPPRPLAPVLFFSAARS